MVYIYLQYPVYSLISSGTVTKYLKVTDYTLLFFIRMIILVLFSAIAYKYFEIPLWKN